MNFIKLLNFYKLINILEQYLFLAEGGSRPLRDFIQHMISKKVTETTFFLTPVDDPISEKKMGHCVKRQ